MAADQVTAGLSEQEAALRLARDGYNDLPAAERRNFWRIVLDVAREPMFALLLAGGLVYGAIGDRADAAILFAFATISVSIAVIQRGRSERVLAALSDLTSPRALVIRSAQRRRIPGREVVAGDTLVLVEGDRVPADGIVISCADLLLDESLLTGESLPVLKQAADAESWHAASPGGDDLANVFSGTLVVRGTALAVATATGERSEIGKIGRAVVGTEMETPRLQQQTKKLLLTFAAASISLSVLAVALYGYLHRDWLHALLGGISLGMSLLPEEIPLVLTVFTVIGAQRLSRSNVLARRAAAIETLGAATVLCVDKTGTLTRNQMSVTHLQSANDEWHSAMNVSHITDVANLRLVLETALLASDRSAFDPMDNALHELERRLHPNQTDASRPRGECLQQFPMRPELPIMTRIWQLQDSPLCVVAAKGAPEVIARICRMTAKEQRKLLDVVDTLACDGIRVLGAARADVARHSLPTAPTDIAMEFVGFVGFADPLRETVPDAVRQCRSAGVRLLMITGDYSGTARSIASQAGIDTAELISGDELEQMSDVLLSERLRSATVCARITPRQKLRIVNALKANGEIVAMTGDGVNDAPALKSAHIGIAMGGRGTDVAREAAALVLLDDDFGSIVKAIRLGRRIYDNLRKALAYILAIHVPIAGMALLPIVLGMPILLTPALIAILEMIIDPACSIALEAEPEERDVMSRPPRSPQAILIPPTLIAASLLQGAVALVVCATLFLFAARRGLPESELRSFALLLLVCINVALIFANRTFTHSLRSALLRSNTPLRWGLMLISAILVTIFAVPAIRSYLGLGPINPANASICFAAGFALLVLLELGKSARWAAMLRS